MVRPNAPLAQSPEEDAMTAVDQVTPRKAGGSPDDGLLAELVDALDRIAAGELKVRLGRRAGAAGEVVDRFNRVVEMQQRSTRELMRISRVVGREGRLTERLDEEGMEGAWGDRVRAVNSLIDELGRPTQ